MAAHSRGPRDRLVASLRGIFGDRLRSVVAYSLDRTESLSCLALVGSLTTADLEACAARAHGWQREGIATPLILPEEEFLRSLDAFPLEYAEIIRAHEALFGASPFDAVRIERADLRRACETQIKSHLVHLREGFIEAGGTPRPIADLVTASAPAFGALLRDALEVGGNGAFHAPPKKIGRPKASGGDRLETVLEALDGLAAQRGAAKHIRECGPH